MPSFSNLIQALDLVSIEKVLAPQHAMTFLSLLQFQILSLLYEAF